MNKKLFTGALLAGVVAIAPAFAQKPAPSPAAAPAAPATAAAPGNTTAGSGASEAPRRKGNEAAKVKEQRATSLLTFDERKEHRAKMAGFKTVDECTSYIDTFWQTVDKRAKEKGVAGPLSGPRADTCEQMKARGQIK